MKVAYYNVVLVKEQCRLDMTHEKVLFLRGW